LFGEFDFPQHRRADSGGTHPFTGSNSQLTTAGDGMADYPALPSGQKLFCDNSVNSTFLPGLATCPFPFALHFCFFPVESTFAVSVLVTGAFWESFNFVPS